MRAGHHTPPHPFSPLFLFATFSHTHLQLRVIGKKYLPPELLRRRAGVELFEARGLFPEIHRAWAVVDNEVYVWDYAAGGDETSAPCEAVLADGDDLVTTVGLVVPPAEMLAARVKYLVVVCSVSRVRVYAATFDGDSVHGAMSLSLCKELGVATDGVHMLKVASTSDGRVFLAGKDGSVHELRIEVYEDVPGFAVLGPALKAGAALTNKLGLGLDVSIPLAKRARCVEHISPWASILRTLTGGMFAPQPYPLIDMTVDHQRRLLYTLAEDGVIRMYWYAAEAGGAFTLVATTPLEPEDACAAFAADTHPVPRADNRPAASKFTKGLAARTLASPDKGFVASKCGWAWPLVSLHVVPLHESHWVHLVAVSKAGARLYFTTAPIDKYKLVMTQLRGRILPVLPRLDAPARPGTCGKGAVTAAAGGAAAPGAASAAASAAHTVALLTGPGSCTYGTSLSLVYVRMPPPLVLASEYTSPAMAGAVEAADGVRPVGNAAGGAAGSSMGAVVITSASSASSASASSSASSDPAPGEAVSVRRALYRDGITLLAGSSTKATSAPAADASAPSGSVVGSDHVIGIAHDYLVRAGTSAAATAAFGSAAGGYGGLVSASSSLLSAQDSRQRNHESVCDLPVEGQVWDLAEAGLSPLPGVLDPVYAPSGAVLLPGGETFVPLSKAATTAVLEGAGATIHEVADARVLERVASGTVGAWAAAASAGASLAGRKRNAFGVLRVGGGEGVGAEGGALPVGTAAGSARGGAAGGAVSSSSRSASVSVVATPDDLAGAVGAPQAALVAAMVPAAQQHAARRRLWDGSASASGGTDVVSDFTRSLYPSLTRTFVVLTSFGVVFLSKTRPLDAIARLLVAGSGAAGAASGAGSSGVPATPGGAAAAAASRLAASGAGAAAGLGLPPAADPDASAFPALAAALPWFTDAVPPDRPENYHEALSLCVALACGEVPQPHVFAGMRLGGAGAGAAGGLTASRALGSIGSVFAPSTPGVPTAVVSAVAVPQKVQELATAALREFGGVPTWRQGTLSYVAADLLPSRLLVAVSTHVARVLRPFFDARCFISSQPTAADAAGPALTLPRFTQAEMQGLADKLGAVASLLRRLYPDVLQKAADIASNAAKSPGGLQAVSDLTILGFEAARLCTLYGMDSSALDPALRELLRGVPALEAFPDRSAPDPHRASRMELVHVMCTYLLVRRAEEAAALLAAYADPFNGVARVLTSIGRGQEVAGFRGAAITPALRRWIKEKRFRDLVFDAKIPGVAGGASALVTPGTVGAAGSASSAAAATAAAAAAAAATGGEREVQAMVEHINSRVLHLLRAAPTSIGLTAAAGSAASSSSSSSSSAPGVLLTDPGAAFAAYLREKCPSFFSRAQHLLFVAKAAADAADTAETLTIGERLRRLRESMAAAVHAVAVMPLVALHASLPLQSEDGETVSGMVRRYQRCGFHEGAIEVALAAARHAASAAAAVSAAAAAASPSYRAREEEGGAASASGVGPASAGGAGGADLSSALPLDADACAATLSGLSPTVACHEMPPAARCPTGIRLRCYALVLETLDLVRAGEVPLALVERAGEGRKGTGASAGGLSSVFARPAASTLNALSASIDALPQPTPASRAFTALLNDVLLARDLLFHDTLYRWLIARGLPGLLVRVASPFVEGFLSTRCSSPDLLYHYYLKRDMFAAAARLQKFVAVDDAAGATEPVSDRVARLELALAAGRQRTTALTGALPEAELLDWERALFTLQRQAEVVAALKAAAEEATAAAAAPGVTAEAAAAATRRAEALTSSAAALTSGPASRPSLDALLRDYALHFQLYEPVLAILSRSCSAATQEVAQTVWERLAAATLAAAADTERRLDVAAAVKKLSALVARLGKRFWAAGGVTGSAALGGLGAGGLPPAALGGDGSSGSPAFPLRFVVRLLEEQALRGWPAGSGALPWALAEPSFTFSWLAVGALGAAGLDWPSRFAAYANSAADAAADVATDPEPYPHFLRVLAELVAAWLAEALADQGSGAAKALLAGGDAVLGALREHRRRLAAGAAGSDPASAAAVAAFESPEAAAGAGEDLAALERQLLALVRDGHIPA